MGSSISIIICKGNMKKLITFDDVLLLPRFSTISSRTECDTSTMLGDIPLELGIISSNMDTITEDKMATVMHKAGGLGALHRFCNVENTILQYRASPPETFVSVGLGDKELSRAKYLLKEGAKNFIIDVANGASNEVVIFYKYLRKIGGERIHIMVGNFGTAQSILEFNRNLDGFQLPDSYKVGIGGGSRCTTRIVTGVGVPTLSSVMDCVGTGFDIVADGGIRNSGDIAKCLAVGAKAVMIGNILSGTEETPGATIVKTLERQYTPSGWYPIKQGVFKNYRGSASKESYEAQGKTSEHRAPEGVSSLVPHKGPALPILQELKAGIRSSMSYVNARNLTEFRENAELVEISSNSLVENHPHGLTKEG